MFDLDVIPQIFSNSKYCIIYSDAERNIIGVYAGSEFPGLRSEKGKIEKLFEEKHQNYIIERVNYCIENKCNLEVELEAINKEFQLLNVVITPIIKFDEVLIGYIIKDVTSKAKLENIILEKEIRNSMFLKHVAESIIFLKGETILDFNEASISLFESSLEEFGVLQLRDILTDSTMQTIVERIKTSTRHLFNGLGITRSGQKIALNVSYEPIIDKEGYTADGVLRVCKQDAGIQEGNAKKNIEAVYDSSLNLVKAGIWYKDLVHDELYWSKGVYQIYDYPMNEAPPKDNWIEFIAQEHRARLDDDLRTLIFQGTQYETELTLKTAKGRKKHTYNKLEVQRAFDGKAVRIIGWVTEI